jgi:putative NADPH-quinone reductase
MNPKNSWLILSHPVVESYCGAIADAYQAGATVQRVWIGGLQFDPDLASGYRHGASIRLEPDFQRVQALIRQADPIVLVYSTW